MENKDLIQNKDQLATKIKNHLQNIPKAYRSQLKSYLKFCESQNVLVGIESLERYFQTVSISTRVVVKASLKKVFEFVFSDETEKLRALENLNKVKTGSKQVGVSVSETFTKEEIDQVLGYLRSKQASKKEKDKNKYLKLAHIIEFFFNTGLRISELINIKLSSIKRINGHSEILIEGKGKKARKIIYKTETILEIVSLFQSQTYLFETRVGNKLDRHNLFRDLQKVFKEVFPNKHFHPHLLRHSFATNQIIAKKKSVKAVSRYLGHSSTAITQDYYVHDELSFEDLFE